MLWENILVLGLKTAFRNSFECWISNQIKAVSSFTSFCKVWYILAIIKWLNVYINFIENKNTDTGKID